MYNTFSVVVTTFI